MPAGWYLRTDTVWAFVIEFGGEFEGVEIMKKYLLANFDFFPKLRTAVYPSNNVEQSSDRRETLAKRVSDDLQLFIFRR